MLRGFSAGSYVGAAVALIACRISQSFHIRSKFDLGFVLDLLHLDDHEFSRQVVARLSKSEDQTSIALSSAQV